MNPAERADLALGEPRRILYLLRERVAQDLAGLSLHLYVLRGRADGAVRASRIDELQTLTSDAFHTFVGLASAIEELSDVLVAPAEAERPAKEDHRDGESPAPATGPRNMGMEALNLANERLKRLAGRLSSLATEDGSPRNNGAQGLGDVV